VHQSNSKTKNGKFATKIVKEKASKHQSRITRYQKWRPYITHVGIAWDVYFCLGQKRLNKIVPQNHKEHVGMPSRLPGYILPNPWYNLTVQLMLPLDQ